MRTDPSYEAPPGAEPADAPLRLLLVEDSEEDSFFLLRYLKRGEREISSERVEALEELSAALECGKWDAVISDWELPGFDALDALRLVRTKDPELPFIIVSGTIGEERAVQAMKAGAQDYVAKSNLARLRAAIEREMAGAEGKRQKRRAEEELKRSEARYRAVVEQTAEGIYLVDAGAGCVIEANHSLHEMLGYAADELRGEHLYDLIAHSPEDIDENLGRTLAEGRRLVGERKYRKKDGSVLDVEVGAGPISYGGQEMVCAVVRDITERKEAQEALKESEEQFRASFDQAAVGMAHVSPLGKFLRVNDRLCEVLGYECKELLKVGFEQVTHRKTSTMISGTWSGCLEARSALTP